MSGEPFIVNIEGVRHSCTPENATLFTHAGALAVFDHVYLRIQDEPPAFSYIPRTADAYPALRDYMRREDFPRHEGMRQVLAADEQTLTAAWLEDLPQIEDIAAAWRLSAE